MQTTIRLLLAVTVPALLASVAGGQVTFTPDQSIGASDAQPYDALGYGMAVDGAAMLVGARGSDTIATNGGVVYAYIRTVNGWVQSQKVVFTNAQSGDEIGAAVALRGSVGVAGAPQRGSRGSAFALRFDGGAWFAVAELTDGEVSVDGEFGASVACTADFIAAGAPASAEGVGAFAGRVRLFSRSGTQWNPATVLRATYPDPGDRFGFSVAMDGPWLAIGAPGDDDAGINSGAVWLYRLQGGQYQLVQKILPAAELGSVAGVSFGQSVSLQGTTLVVGAPLVDSSASDAGAAVVYDVGDGGASIRSVLSPAGGSLHAQFGFAVATDGTSVVVGAPGLTIAGQLRGGAFLYLAGDKSSGVLAPGGLPSLSLTGTRVAVTDTSVLAAAPTATAGVLSGVGRILVLDRTRDCDSSGLPDAIELATGALVDLNGDGIPDECQCVADLSGDGFVNASDLAILLAFWASTNPSLPGADIDRNGVVGASDLAVLLGTWGICQ